MAIPCPSDVCAANGERVQRTDGQVAFHAIADRPADHAPRMQIEDDSEIEPALPRSDIADVTRPFLVGAIRREVPVQQVRCDVEAVVAVRGRLELLVPPDLYPVLFHQSANPAMTHSQSQPFQFFRHPWHPVIHTFG